MIKKLKPTNALWPRYMIQARDQYVADLFNIAHLDIQEIKKFVKLKFGYSIGRATIFRIKKKLKINNENNGT